MQTGPGARRKVTRAEGSATHEEETTQRFASLAKSVGAAFELTLYSSWVPLVSLSEIPLIHLDNLQRRAFQAGRRISADVTSNQPLCG